MLLAFNDNKVAGTKTYADQTGRHPTGTATAATQQYEAGAPNAPVTMTTGFNTYHNTPTTGPVIQYPTSADWFFGTGDFTVEFFFKTGFIRPIYNSYLGPFSGGGPWFVQQPGGGGDIDLLGCAIAGPTADNLSHHYAWSRIGANLRGFKDGVLLNTIAAGAINVVSNGLPLFIGDQGTGVENQAVTGQWFCLRITKAGRYAATFTVPKAPFPVL
jgi:hypothetical protein